MHVSAPRLAAQVHDKVRICELLSGLIDLARRHCSPFLTSGRDIHSLHGIAGKFSSEWCCSIGKVLGKRAWQEPEWIFARGCCRSLNREAALIGL